MSEILGSSLKSGCDSQAFLQVWLLAHPENNGFIFSSAAQPSRSFLPKGTPLQNAIGKGSLGNIISLTLKGCDYGTDFGSRQSIPASSPCFRHEHIGGHLLTTHPCQSLCSAFPVFSAKFCSSPSGGVDRGRRRGESFIFYILQIQKLTLREDPQLK